MNDPNGKEKAPRQRWRAEEGRKSKQRELDDCISGLPKCGPVVKELRPLSLLPKPLVRLVGNRWVLLKGELS